MTDLSLPPQAALPLAARWPPLAPIVAPTALIDAIDRQARRPAVRIGEALLALGLIDERTLGDALQQQTHDRTRPLGELLVQRGIVSRGDLQAALAHRMGFPIVDAAAFPVAPEAVERIPEAVARRLRALPLLLNGDRLVVALEDPSARIVVDELEATADCDVLPVLACAGSLAPALERLYAAASSPSAPCGAADDGAELRKEPLPGALGHAPAGAQGSSEPRLQEQLATLLWDAHAAGATALHLECPDAPQPLRVLQRCAGRLRLAAELPAQWHGPLTTTIKTLAGLDPAETRRPQSARVDLPGIVAGQVLRLQVTTLPTADGPEDLVLRLSTPPRARRLQDLGLPGPLLARFVAAIEAPHGLVLCVGPRGSGLSTLLHAALAHLNTPLRRLWTVEPALEIRQPGLRQLQPQPRIDHTAAKALRALQEADADVVMVDAPADGEALREACALAQAGPLVIAAVQATDAAQARALLGAAGADAQALRQLLRGTLALAPGRAAVFSSVDDQDTAA